MSWDSGKLVWTVFFDNISLWSYRAEVPAWNNFIRSNFSRSTRDLIKNKHIYCALRAYWKIAISVSFKPCCRRTMIWMMPLCMSGDVIALAWYNHKHILGAIGNYDLGIPIDRLDLSTSLLAVGNVLRCLSKQSKHCNCFVPFAYWWSHSIYVYLFTK